VIRHIFLWSMLAKLAQLETAVPGLRGFTIGEHQGEAPNATSGAWRYALTCDFDSFEDLDRYQNHSEHQKIVDEVADAYLEWVVVDYQIGPDSEAA
jgi:hypothetical protein